MFDFPGQFHHNLFTPEESEGYEVTMQELINAARWEGIILVSAFGFVTMWRLIRSGSMDGLLRAGDGGFSPGRVQLLVLTVFAAMQYLLTTIRDPSQLPVIPAGLVTAVGGSHLLYLGSKALDVFRLKSNRGGK